MTPAASVFMSAREAGKPRRWPLRMLVTVAQSDSSQAGHPSIPEPPSSPVRARLPFSCRLGRGGGRRGKPGRPRCPGRRFKHPAQQPPPFVSLVSPPFCPRGGGGFRWARLLHSGRRRSRALPPSQGNKKPWGDLPSSIRPGLVPVFAWPSSLARCGQSPLWLVRLHRRGGLKACPL